MLGCFPSNGVPRLKSTVQLAHRIAALAAEKLATDIVILDMRDVVSYTDHFIICTGRTPRQTQAISDAIRESLKRDDKRSAQRVAGAREGAWIVVDYLDVVLHVFTPDAREFYRLEELWSDVPAVDADAAAV